MKSKPFRERVVEIFDREISTTIRYEKNGGAGVTIYGLDRATNAICQAVEELVGEIIGEDNKNTIRSLNGKGAHNPVITAQNKLRVQQRNRLKERLNQRREK